jgi:hypothetical protein
MSQLLEQIVQRSFSSCICSRINYIFKTRGKKMSTFPLEGFVVLTNLEVTLCILAKIHRSFVNTYSHSRVSMMMCLDSGGQVSRKRKNCTRPNGITSLTTGKHISNKIMHVTKIIIFT